MPPLGFDPSAIAPAVANRALERETWAQACLAAHAGSVFVFAVGPVATTLRIDAAGKVESVSGPESPPGLRLTVSPLALPAFLADPRRWDELVAAEGDPALASTLKGLAETLPWFVERALADALGPIVGQRIADAGRRLLAFPEYAAARVGESVASYARDEAKVAAHATEVRSLGEDAAAVAARVDALALRVDAIAARLADNSPGKRSS
jgi:ubiquinone biosynthesis protein UbiJ